MSIIGSADGAGTLKTFDVDSVAANVGTYQYARYLAPNYTYGVIAELKIYGY